MEKRRFPRTELCARQRLLHFSSENLVRNVVISRNLSASGFCFRSTFPYESGTRLLVRLDQSVLDDICENRAHVMKAGNFFMAEIIWSRLAPLDDAEFYDIGCSFLPIGSGSNDDVALFTRLVNQYAADAMSAPL